MGVREKRIKQLEAVKVRDKGFNLHFFLSTMAFIAHSRQIFPTTFMLHFFLTMDVFFFFSLPSSPITLIFFLDTSFCPPFAIPQEKKLFFCYLLLPLRKSFYLGNENWHHQEMQSVCVLAMSFLQKHTFHANLFLSPAFQELFTLQQSFLIYFTYQIGFRLLFLLPSQKGTMQSSVSREKVRNCS